MDYSSWCDELCAEIADYADGQPDRYISLHAFADWYVSKHQLDGRLHEKDSIVPACVDVFRTFDIQSDSPVVRLSRRDVDVLRQRYERWQAVYDIELRGRDRPILEALNRLSLKEDHGVWLSNYVILEDILADSTLESLTPPLSPDEALEIFEELDEHQLVRSNLEIGRSSFKSTYAGATRVSRDQVLSDREIDNLRLQGESDSLDYKRQIDVASRTGKAEFAKDVLVFANAGGTTAHLLVGVENDGAFHVPNDPVAHQAAIMSLNETSLQQIVSERCIHAPSIRITARGMHRDGPYALIEITSNIGHLPYRFFANPADAKLPNASQSGEVWIRKGTTKGRATADEIDALEKRAALYRTVHP